MASYTITIVFPRGFSTVARVAVLVWYGIMGMFAWNFANAGQTGTFQAVMLAVMTTFWFCVGYVGLLWWSELVIEAVDEAKREMNQ